MNLSKHLAIAVASLSLIGVQSAKADTILHYTFNPGTFYNFEGGASTTPTGSFDYDVNTFTFSNVNYTRGVDTFHTATLGAPFEIYFGDTTSADYDVYEFKNTLDKGGTIGISNGFHPSIVVDVGGSITTDTVAGVPEPASWALMMAGFGLVGSVVRSRRATGTVTAA